jgi:hypothetical protein
MVQYTLAQSPEVILTVAGRDSLKAREKAMAQLIELMDEGKLDTDLADGFSPQQFVEVKEPSTTLSDQDDAVTQAVQLLNNLATLKIKVQELRGEALKIRAQVDILFSDAIVTEEEINSLKEGFKILKSFAQVNLRYLDARSQAEEARAVLDQALNTSPEELNLAKNQVSEPKLEQPKPEVPELEAAEPPVEEVKNAEIDAEIEEDAIAVPAEVLPAKAPIKESTKAKK